MAHTYMTVTYAVSMIDVGFYLVLLKLIIISSKVMTKAEYKAYTYAQRQRVSFISTGWQVIGELSNPKGWQLAHNNGGQIDIELYLCNGLAVCCIVKNGKVIQSEHWE